MKKNSIGLISGMGPLAGAEVWQKILSYSAKKYGAVEDSEYPNLVVISYGIQGFDAHGNISDSFKPKLLATINQLRKFKPIAFGIACNTAHLFVEEFESSISSKLVNVVEETAKQAGQVEGLYLLLTSATTRSSKLYEPYLIKYGANFETLSKPQQDIIDHTINLVMAHRLVEAGEKLDSLLKQLGSRKYTGLIVGCTELPIAAAYSKLAREFMIVDSSAVLAERLTDEYYMQIKAE